MHRDNFLEQPTDKLTKERDELRAREEEMVTLSECEKFMTDILPVAPVNVGNCISSSRDEYGCHSGPAFLCQFTGPPKENCAP